MLRDAKEEAETASKLEEEEKERQRAHFGILFDQYQGETVVRLSTLHSWEC